MDIGERDRPRHADRWGPEPARKDRRPGRAGKLRSFRRRRAAQAARRLDLAEAHPQDEVEPAARLTQREAGRGKQRLRRRGLENPAHPLLGLHDRDRLIAVIGHERRQRVALGQDIGGVSARAAASRSPASARNPSSRASGSAGPSGIAPVKISANASAAKMSPSGAAHSPAFAISAEAGPARAADLGDPVGGQNRRRRIERGEPVALDAIVDGMEKEIDRRRRDRAGEHAPGFVARSRTRRGSRHGMVAIAGMRAAKTSGLMRPTCETRNSAI